MSVLVAACCATAMAQDNSGGSAGDGDSPTNPANQSTSSQKMPSKVVTPKKHAKKSSKKPTANRSLKRDNPMSKSTTTSNTANPPTGNSMKPSDSSTSAPSGY